MVLAKWNSTATILKLGLKHSVAECVEGVASRMLRKPPYKTSSYGSPPWSHIEDGGLFFSNFQWMIWMVKHHPSFTISWGSYGGINKSNLWKTLSSTVHCATCPAAVMCGWMGEMVKQCNCQAVLVVVVTMTMLCSGLPMDQTSPRRISNIYKRPRWHALTISLAPWACDARTVGGFRVAGATG